MKKNQNKKENGSILMIVLVLLAVLSVIVTLGYESSSFETALAGNDRIITRTRLTAESSASTAVQLLENMANESIRADGAEMLDRSLIDTNWDDEGRLPWLHKGENNCVIERQAMDNNDDKEIYKIVEEWEYLANARIFSQTYYISDDDTDEDNWGQQSSIGLTDSENKSVPTMEAARFMAIEYSVAKTESLATGLTPHLKRKNYLISGVDERNNGMAMIQMGFSKLVPVSD